MFKISSKIKILSLLILICLCSRAQTTDKVKAVVSDLPSTMNVGQTYKVTCTITNTGRNVWSSENLHTKAYGPFEITKEWEGEWKLQPGESTTTYYKVTAPNKSGSYKLKVILFDNNKKIAKRSKKIEVVDSSVPPK